MFLLVGGVIPGMREEEQRVIPGMREEEQKRKDQQCAGQGRIPETLSRKC